MLGITAFLQPRGFEPTISPAPTTPSSSAAHTAPAASAVSAAPAACTRAAGDRLSDEKQQPQQGGESHVGGPFGRSVSPSASNTLLGSLPAAGAALSSTTAGVTDPAFGYQRGHVGLVSNPLLVVRPSTQVHGASLTSATGASLHISSGGSNSQAATQGQYDSCAPSTSTIPPALLSGSNFLNQ